MRANNYCSYWAFLKSEAVHAGRLLTREARTWSAGRKPSVKASVSSTMSFFSDSPPFYHSHPPPRHPFLLQGRKKTEDVGRSDTRVMFPLKCQASGWVWISGQRIGEKVSGSGWGWLKNGVEWGANPRALFNLLAFVAMGWNWRDGNFSNVFLAPLVYILPIISNLLSRVDCSVLQVIVKECPHTTTKQLDFSCIFGSASFRH